MRGCTCCAAWARHFEAAGFGTEIHELDDLVPIRAEAGVPDDLGGCHTAKVAGYVVEGHVPVAAVQRMLTERPKARFSEATDAVGDDEDAGSSQEGQYDAAEPVLAPVQSFVGQQPCAIVLDHAADPAQS